MLDWIFKISSFVFGIGCLYLGLFIYEDEERKIKNKLEEYWIRFDDKKQNITKNIFERINLLIYFFNQKFIYFFGEKTISLQFIKVSFGFSFYSFILLCVCYNNLYNFLSNWVEIIMPFELYCLSSYFFAGLIIYCSMQTEVKHKNWKLFRKIGSILFYSFWLSILLGCILQYINQKNASVSFFYFLLPSLTFFISIILSISSIALIKYFVKRFSTLPTIFNLIPLLIITAFFVFLNYKIATTHFSEKSIDNVIRTISITNILPRYLSLFLFLSIALIYLNHLFWQIIQRPLYTFQKYYSNDLKKPLFFIGIFLVLYALNLKEIYEDLKGRIEIGF